MQRHTPPGPGGGPRHGDSHLALFKLLERTKQRTLAVSAATGASLLVAGALLVGLAISLILGLVFDDGVSPAPSWLLPAVMLLFLTGAAAVAWRFVIRPLREVGDDRGAAAFLESTLPGSAGLASAVQFHSELQQIEEPDSRASYSAELAGAHVSRMAGVSRRLDPRRAVSLDLLRRSAAGLAGVAAFHLVFTLFAADPIMRGYGLLFGRGGSIPGLDEAGIWSVQELITGDVELVYHYPEYTGLPSRTVSGTGGDIRALKGTEVELRTRADRDVAGAAIAVGETVITMSVADDRDLHGRLLVSEAGHYRFRFLDARGRTTAEGPTHRIGVEPDEYPDIEVSVVDHPSEDEIEIREQARLVLDFRARDDFGLDEIAVAWRIRGGQEQRAIVRRGGGRDRIEGRWAWDLTTLNLAPGDRVGWHLEALDNDTITGPKRSTTRTRYLKVFSAAEHHRALMAKVEEHWEAMIDKLADHLEAPFQPAEREIGPGDIEEAVTAFRLGEEMNRLTDAIADTVEELREDPLSPVALVNALDNIQAGLVTANRRFESAVRLFQSHSRVRGQVDRSQALRVRSGQDRIVTELENGILYLESLLDKQRLEDIIAMAEEIREHQRRLQDLVERLRDNPDEETRAAISEEMARIKERIHELMQRMAELAKGIRDEHLNMEAVEQLQEQDDLLSGLDEIQRMLEEGDLDEALSRLLDMANQLDSLIEDFRNQDESFGGEQYAELQREVMEFMDELHRVKRDQDNLLEESEELRDQYRRALEERLEGRIDDLVERLTRLAQEGRQHLYDVPEETLDHGFSRLDREAVESAVWRLEDVERLLEARDFEEARKMAEEALDNASRAAGSFAEQSRNAHRYQAFMGVRPEDLQTAARKSERARSNAGQIVEGLDQLFPDPNEVFSPCEQERMGEMAGEQRELRRRSRDLQRRMQSIGEQAPLFSPDMERSLQVAGQHMSEAGSRLDQADARQASSQQRAASERLSELQRQMEEAAEQSGQGQGIPMPLAGSSGGRRGGSGQFSQEPVDIPDADQFEAPEQFRRDLLEAMREGTPERYQEQVRRYYEELVR